MCSPCLEAVTLQKLEYEESNAGISSDSATANLTDDRNGWDVWGGNHSRTDCNLFMSLSISAEYQFCTYSINVISMDTLQDHMLRIIAHLRFQKGKIKEKILKLPLVNI